MRLRSNFVKRACRYGDAMKIRLRGLRTVILLLAFGASCTLQSCRYGTTAQSFPPAQTPKGVTGHVVTSRADYTAELIEIRDNGIVILAERTFRFVPYSTIASWRFDGVGASISRRGTPSAENRER